MNTTRLLMEVICKACSFEISEQVLNKYCICQSCGSAMYVTSSSASEDNKEYFNKIYSDNKLHVNQGRKRQFERFLWLDTIMHAGETASFGQFQSKISDLIVGAEKSVEIGFGRGDELVKFLQAGANMHGLDLSSEAVGNFKERHPEYSDRVACATTFDFSADMVYSNALFEHLDDPGELLDNAGKMLNPGGRLVVRLPVMTRMIRHRNETETDINFWKPCHRALYTLKGLTILLEKHGFRIMAHASLAYYGYKVMSRMLRLGYDDIVYARCPYYQIKGLDSDFVYNKILLQSLFDKVICSDFALIAARN